MMSHASSGGCISSTFFLCTLSIVYKVSIVCKESIVYKESIVCKESIGMKSEHEGVLHPCLNH